MNRLTSAPRLGSLQIILHWATFFILVAVYACIELKEFFPKGSETRELMKSLHFTLGLTVLLLALVRLVIYLARPSRNAGAQQPRWQCVFAGAVKIALYAFMIAMPILGWLLLSYESEPIPFYGIRLFPLTDANSTLAEQVEEIHEAIGTVGYALIALHTAAALVHHYVLRDDTLLRMLPRWGARKQSPHR